MQNIILIAPPAAGKGTQSKLICEKYQIPHISTGDLLRSAAKEESDMGELIRKTMESGSLVTDEIVLKLFEERIKKSDCENGFVLDGFPRNISQAESYLEILNNQNKPLGIAIYLDVPKEITRKRIVGRRSCPTCGSVYNVELDTSLNGLCNKCGVELIKRADDTDEIFNERYKVYENETYPLVDFFKQKDLLTTIGYKESIEETFAEIEKIINRGNI